MACLQIAGFDTDGVLVCPLAEDGAKEKRMQSSQDKFFFLVGTFCPMDICTQDQYFWGDPGALIY